MSTQPAEIVPDLGALERLAGAVADTLGLHGLCAMITTRLGGRGFAYGLRQVSSLVQPELVFLSSYPEPLLREYRDDDLVRIDAVVEYAHRHAIPASWSEAWDRYGTRGNRARVLSLFGRHGFETGVVVPVHGACGQLSIFSVGGADTPAFRGRLRQWVTQAPYLAALVHEAAVRIAARPGRAPPALTERERQCLAWAAEGKTAWETAQILGIAERTVIFHLQNACVKLGVSNRQQALARAISLGLMASAIQRLPEPG